MLPDYPKLKSQLEEKLSTRIREESTSPSSPLSRIPRVQVFEGSKSIMTRADGTEATIEFTEMRVEMEINAKDVENMTFDEMLARYKSAGEDLARQQAKHFYSEIDKSVEEVGNVVSGKDRPNVEDFFEMLEKLWIDFDDNGQPTGQSIYTGEENYETILKMIEQIENNPELKKRHNAIMELKKEEWRVRESRRKLVG